MAADFILQIPEPCHEVWDKMETVPCGKHCNVCAKNVVDFTGFTDVELITFFTRYEQSSICGRLHQDQLNRVLQPQIPAPSFRLTQWQRIVACILSLQAFTFQSFAQKQKKPDHTFVASKHNKRPNQCTGQLLAFDGKITSPFTFRIILGTSGPVQVTTDSNGHFTCQLPPGVTDIEVSWLRQEVNDGIIIPSSQQVSLSSVYNEPLRIFWQPVLHLQPVLFEVKSNWPVYSGIIPNPNHQAAPVKKKNWLQRLGAKFKPKKRG